MLTIHNSLSRSKQPFEPIEPGKVRMYVCGMTVYDYCHLGHARALVVFDVITRYLRWSGYDVDYVRNITDIDDKIIARANENGEDFRDLTARFIAAMHEDCHNLGVLPPDHEPRATDAVDGMLAMITTLIDNGHAYVADNGDVYYDVSHFPDYGKLSGKKIDDLRAGARVEIAEAKDDPLDFALWKAAKPGEPSWDSPWGPGRPGWHIECSVMSTAALGNHFDIHGGGRDLQFPHHENEIAQSEGATGEPFGNFLTIREILERYRAEEVRYFIVNSHYRSPLNYSEEALGQAHGALERLYTALRDLPQDEGVDEAYQARFTAAMDDDFNTAEAVAVLFELAREINRARETEPARAALLGNTLRTLGGVLGLLQDDPVAFLQAGPGAGDGLDDAAIEAQIEARNQARKRRHQLAARLSRAFPSGSDVGLKPDLHPRQTHHSCRSDFSPTRRPKSG
jgi:cysteinyl-tRNA synthetase